MHINYIKKSLIIAALTVSIALGGCSGKSNNGEGESSLSEATTFSVPEDTEEVTPDVDGTSEKSTEEITDESTEESGSETAVEVVEIPMESETETPSETDNPSDTNHIVVLDPGHGGMWPGAEDGEYKEKDLALTMAFYCRDYLLEHYDDVTVYLTRETDIDFSVDQKEDLEERVRIAADYGAEVMVSLHFNSDSTDTANGALVCVSKQPWVSEEAASLGTSILNQLEGLGIDIRRGLLYRDSTEYFDENGEALDYYSICRNSASLGFVGIIVEHCFMRNEIDRQFYITDEAVENLAVADAIGIAQYLGLSERES